MGTRRTAPVAQLDLFKGADPLAPVYREAAELVARLPERLHLGTSSWFFPGWEGLVWSGRFSESDLAREGLREYARHPLLTTVGIDRSFYAPVPAADFARYASQLPPGFRCAIKAPASVTSAVVPHRPRGDAEANRDYLSVERFRADLGDALVSSFLPHTAMVILEFPRAPRALTGDPRSFAQRLARFIADVDPRIPVAVELRDPTLLQTVYAQALADAGAAHVYSMHAHMPLPGAQRAVVPLRRQPFAVLRLSLPPHTNYDERKQDFAPFDRLRDVDPARRDDVLSVLREALALDRDTWVLVNNKAEGSAPLTLRALAQALATAGAGFNNSTFR